MMQHYHEHHGTGILFEEPNPAGSRPRDLIGLYKQQRKPHPPNTQGRARRKHGVDQGHPEEAESQPEEAERRKKDAKREGGERGGDQGNPESAGIREGPKQREDTEGGGWRNRRGSAAARPTLTPGLVYGGPQVRDHMPIVSVNPEAR